MENQFDFVQFLIASHKRRDVESTENVEGGSEDGSNEIEKLS